MTFKRRTRTAKLVLSADFAQAYVIAHEVGNHLQKLTGTFKRDLASGNPTDCDTFSTGSL